MLTLGINEITTLVRRIGVRNFLGMLSNRHRQDLINWPAFDKSPRHATQFEHGVIELMPCAGDGYYAFKYVNGHPHNVSAGLPTVVAFGALAEVEHGMPLMIAEMTLLTALRTAASAAIGADCLARKDTSTLGLIGCGAQAEFQALALANVRPIVGIRYYDTDPAAMEKFAENLTDQGFRLHPCDNIASVLSDCDMLVTATAARRKARLFTADQIPPGTHIHALGGDCPGKTELDPDLLNQARVIVEYLPQSRDEGEIQNLATAGTVAELWQVVSGEQPGRQSSDEITILDSVGFALQDYSALRLVYDLAREHELGREVDLVARPRDPKNLYALLRENT